MSGQGQRSLRRQSQWQLDERGSLCHFYHHRLIDDRLRNTGWYQGNRSRGSGCRGNHSSGRSRGYGSPASSNITRWSSGSLATRLSTRSRLHISSFSPLRNPIFSGMRLVLFEIHSVFFLGGGSPQFQPRAGLSRTLRTMDQWFLCGGRMNWPSLRTVKVRRVFLGFSGRQFFRRNSIFFGRQSVCARAAWFPSGGPLSPCPPVVGTVFSIVSLPPTEL